MILDVSPLVLNQGVSLKYVSDVKKRNLCSCFVRRLPLVSNTSGMVNRQC